MTQEKSGHKIKKLLTHPSHSTKLFLAAIFHGLFVVLICLIIAEAVKVI